MKGKIIISTAIVSLALLMAGCKKDAPGGHADYKQPQLPATSYDYVSLSKQLPSNLISVTNDKATLGRVLFYDKTLSVNNFIACGSCHVQQMGFADGRRFSEGFELLTTPRNSPAIINAGAMRKYFWDARATKGLKDMVLMPVQNHLEMGIENLQYVEAKLAAVPYYAPLFKKAFGSEEVTESKVREALANFLASVVTANNKFDKWSRTGQTSHFTPIEKQGLELFNSLHCVSCHSLDLSSISWNSERLANIGLEMNYKDKGAFDVNGEGVFKVPSLRNVGLTAPYMHDGRFNTLEEVVDHYNSGIVKHPNLDWSLTNHNLANFNSWLPIEQQRPIIGGMDDPARLSLTDNEKTALVAFLKSLTDYSMISNPAYSDPFNY